MSNQYEVYIEANEPWTVGQSQAVRDAVLAFCECKTSDVVEVYQEQGFGMDDADAQLTNYCGPDYDGFGANAHEDADGFVFSDKNVADRFADEVRANVRNLSMTVKMWAL